MGLLEKALEYKKAMNQRGEVTLIDKIQGPAETELVGEEVPETLTEEDTLNIDSFTNDNAGTISGDNSVDENTDDSGWPADNNLADDLFDLPEDDSNSPLSALEEQRNNIENNYDEILSDRQEDNKREEAGIPYKLEISGPLTSDDDPVLPKDIDAVADQKRQESMPGGSDALVQESFKKNFEEDIEIGHPVNPGIDITDEAEDLIIEPSSVFDDSEPVKSENNFNAADSFDISDREGVHDHAFQEHTTLYEISKEITKSETRKALFEVIVFSVMGQIGTSSASVMIKDPDNDQWIITHSIGLKTGGNTYSFNTSSGILKNLKKDIIDVDEYKDLQDYQESYNELNSIGIKLLVPWFYKGKVLGILALGEKITDDNYTSDELDFIEAVCESSAIELNKINTIEKLKSDTENSKTGIDFLRNISDIQEKILAKNNLNSAADLIKTEFESVGILKYAVFIFDEIKNRYIPVITDGMDLTGTIENNSLFLSFIRNHRDGVRVTDFNILESVRDIFGTEIINKISLFWIFPFFAGQQLLGFTAVFGVKEILQKESEEGDINSKLDQFSKMIISSLVNLKKVDPDENKYIDNIEQFYNKINTELLRSKDMNIPLSLIIFSIKNYKRYGSVFGYEKARELIDNFSGLIKSRLSDTDFSARYDRNKIITVLPGKDKKYTNIFANAVVNEFMQGFRKAEMQLLVTFLNSEYPEDGDNLLTLLDIID